MASCLPPRAPQQLAGASQAVRVWAPGAPWAASSAPAGCNCPAATASPPAHVPQGGSAAGCASGRHADGGRPWKRESLVV